VADLTALYAAWASKYERENAIMPLDSAQIAAAAMFYKQVSDWKESHE
jgi:hypothetical protein